MTENKSKFKVWIDQDLCTGDGLCAEICPKIFYMHDDGLAYVKQVNDPTGLDTDGNPNLQMGNGLADVPENLLELVIESAEECPGECIFIEHEE